MSIDYQPIFTRSGYLRPAPTIFSHSESSSHTISTLRLSSTVTFSSFILSITDSSSDKAPAPACERREICKDDSEGSDARRGREGASHFVVRHDTAGGQNSKWDKRAFLLLMIWDGYRTRCIKAASKIHTSHNPSGGEKELFHTNRSRSGHALSKQSRC